MLAATGERRLSIWSLLPCEGTNCFDARVGLKVTSLKCTHEDAGDEEAETRQIPDTLKYSEKVERDSEVGLVCEEPASQAMTQGSDERSSQESIQVMESTQTRQDAITKGMLQKMVRL